MGHGAASRRASPVARGLVASALDPVGGRGGARSGTAVRRRRPARRGGGRQHASASRSAPPTSPTSRRPRTRRSAAEPGPGGQPRARRRARHAGRAGLPDVSRSQFAVQPIQEQDVPAYGDLDLPEQFEGPGQRDDDRRGDRAADEAEPRPDRLPHGNPDGRRRHPDGQPPRQPDLLRRHSAHPLRPLLVPPAGRPAAERRQHQLSPRLHVQAAAPHPAVQGRQAVSPRPSSRTPSATRSTTSTRSTWTRSPPP